jgi:predicted transcriptional regulator
MAQSQMIRVEIVEVLEAISDNLSFNILDILVKNEQTMKGLGENLNISNKQCYGRIVKFLDTGLIKRKGMNYVITSFGRLIFEAQLKVARAIQSLSKLKMLEQE